MNIMSESENDSNIDLEKLSPSLINYFKDDHNINKNIQTDWVPSKTHGLNNSFIIIPEYYHKKGEKVLKLHYYEMIIDDIRNFRKLNEHQLNFIKNLDDENKQELFLEFNKLIDIIHILIDK
jgi:hypothetical protein